VIITRLAIPDLLLISNQAFTDNRGFFTERFRQDWWNETKLPYQFVQDNFSRSNPGVLRGLHAQCDPAMGKLVTCLSGHILDIAVDVRARSATFGQSVAVELSGTDPKWFWLPPGFAHGFCVLGEASADVLYKTTAYYNAVGEFGIHYADPELNIKWPLQNPQLSAKDLQLQSFKSYRANAKF
jgi:dTDP-4-dehydrorhamnose 3,5-epimerase